MNTGMMLIGAFLIVAGIFGYIYSQDQQGLIQEGRDALTGDSQDWEMIQALSAAGLVGGIILLVIGAITGENQNHRSI